VDLRHLGADDQPVRRRVEAALRVVGGGDVVGRIVSVLGPVPVRAVERRRAVPGVVERRDANVGAPGRRGGEQQDEEEPGEE
jgi:hypothetical protein